jgi:dTDP-4-amino-4,6-dideoxygalactose transaminase
LHRGNEILIPYARQSISHRDVYAVVKSLRNDFLTTGPLVEKFENELESVVGAPTVVVSSGTAALHAAYSAIELQPGDEIIASPMTFIATHATAALFGAKIVFADINRKTGNIDPANVEALINHRTKAVVGVDYAGQPIELDELKRITEKNNIYLVEDAAHSLGSKYKEKSVGSVADITTFSFFATKNITSGEGGAVASNNPNLLDRARFFSRQGMVRNSNDFKLTDQGAWHQEVHEFGLNYRLPDILCALGISQLQKLDQFKTKRNTIRENYLQALKDVNGIEFLEKDGTSDPVWHLFPIFVPKESRSQIFDDLAKWGIKAQVNYIPSYWHPVFQDLGYKRGLCPNAEDFYQRELSLPFYVDLTRRKQQEIIKAIKSLASNL